MRLSTVTLRRRNISGGRQSLFFDYYPAIRDPETMKMVRWEYIGIYIWEKPRNAIEREYNNEMLMKAEAIRSMRVQSIINEEFGFLDKHKRSADFLAYWKKHAIKRYDKFYMAYKHFEHFCKGHCTFGDLTVDFCRKYEEYLSSAHSLKIPTKPLSPNTASAYYRTFKFELGTAYREKFLRENIADFLGHIDEVDTHKEYLTLDEVKQLSATPCRHDVLRRAALFSCLTGLRVSDIQKLRWDEIELAPDGEWCMRIRTEKTDTEATLPISAEALELCGERPTDDEVRDNKKRALVFWDFRRCMIQYPLRDWLKASGIKKHITFHCFRHTFATLQIALGTDIYTVSKMLTHRNVTTTQIYANLVSSKKRESANKISLR